MSEAVRSEDIIVVAALIGFLWALQLTNRRVVVASAFIIVSFVGLELSMSYGVTGWVSATVAADALLVLAVYATQRSNARRWRLENQDGLVLDPPFLGTWIAVAGGPYPGGNHHLVANSQRFACDFVKIGKTFGEPIFSPCSGVVMEARDGIEDFPGGVALKGYVDEADAPGNYVVIRTERADLYLCHLRKASIAIRKGDHVTSGMYIADCGNSGNSSQPHLHLHAQTDSDLGRAAGKAVAVRLRDRSGSVRVIQKGSFVRGSRRAISPNRTA